MKRVTVEKTVRFTLTAEELCKRLRVVRAKFSTVYGTGDDGTPGLLSLNVEYSTPVKPRGEKAE